MMEIRGVGCQACGGPNRRNEALGRQRMYTPYRGGSQQKKEGSRSGREGAMEK